MITNLTFGECLKCLLSTLDISINRLSKAINVDSSLVNRWVHEKRIPSYNTPYIEGISEYLSKSVHNSFQEQHIDELYFNVYKGSESSDNIREKIRKLLLESQGYSVECKKRERKEQISKFLNNGQDCFNGNNTNRNFMWKTDSINHSTSLSSEDKIIYGTENVLAASIFLLEAAASQGVRNNNTIYLTYYSNMDIENYPLNDLIRWRNALLKAIKKGWNVLLLLRLNSNINRTIKFINFAIPLIKTGQFIPYYIKKYDNLVIDSEIMAVPEIGALSCFSTNLHSEINCAFYLKSKAAINIFKDYFHVVLASCAQPLVKNYSNKNSIDYSYCLAESEEDIGNRFLYKYCFSVLALPENLYQKLLSKKKLPNDEMQKEMELYKRRLNAFLSNIRNYEYKDIYFADSIRQLIIHHQFYFYSHVGIELVDLEVQDIIDCLQNIINLLNTYDNYNIAFISRNNNRSAYSNNFYCIVKERQAVLLEIFRPSRSMPEMKLSIQEPMLVKAFDEYFKEIWEQIAPVNRDKKDIIAWIQKQIDILNK